MESEEKSVGFGDLYDFICETLKTNGTVTFTANGTSMLPWIRNGQDRVTLCSLPDNLRPGDVVFYRRKNGDFVLHRLISRNNGAFAFCDDNQFRIERGIKKSDMIGVLSGLERGGSIYDLSSGKYAVYRAFLPCRRLFLRVRYGCGRLYKKLFRH